MSQGYDRKSNKTDTCLYKMMVSNIQPRACNTKMMEMPSSSLVLGPVPKGRGFLQEDLNLVFDSPAGAAKLLGCSEHSCVAHSVI